jgi:hypothetical protein
MGASLPLGVVAKAALAAAGVAAVVPGTVAVAGAVHDFATGPGGPGWLTGKTAPQRRQTLAQQLAQAQDMALNSGIKPTTP